MFPSCFSQAGGDQRLATTSDRHPPILQPQQLHGHVFGLQLCGGQRIIVVHAIMCAVQKHTRMPHGCRTVSRAADGPGLEGCIMVALGCGLCSPDGDVVDAFEGLLALNHITERQQRKRRVAQGEPVSCSRIADFIRDVDLRSLLEIGLLIRRSLPFRGSGNVHRTQRLGHSTVKRHAPVCHELCERREGVGQ